MAFSNLKSFFQDNLKNKENTLQTENKNTKPRKPLSKKYEEWGFEKSRELKGSHSGFLQCLARIREDHRRMIQQDKYKQRILKEPLITKKNTKIEEIKHKNKEIDNLKDKSLFLENKIESSKKDIISIRKNPKEIMPDKMSKFSCIIGLVILIVLSIYLFVFYSSASFSAFFKEFHLNEIRVADAIFDPQAISKAYKDGFTELILIISMPFVFLGLGFLIHKFQEEKGYQKFLKIGVLIFITFVFDVILAYEITKKIYSIKVENSFQKFPEYNFQLAFESVNFWLIIFAGFIVYLIWGFVFDFTMKTYDKINVVKQAIKSKQSEILINEEKLEKNEKNIIKLKKDINFFELECKELQDKINGAIIDTVELNKMLHEFGTGWVSWMHESNMELSYIDETTKKLHNFIAHIKTSETNNLTIV